MSPSPAAHYILNFPSLQPQNSYLRLCGCASFSFSSRPCTGKRLGQGEGSIYLETEYLFHCISRHVGQQLWQLQCACLALWITCVHANQHQRKGKNKKIKIWRLTLKQFICMHLTWSEFFSHYFIPKPGVGVINVCTITMLISYK